MLRSVLLFERVELIKPIKDGFITDVYSFPYLWVREPLCCGGSPMKPFLRR